VEGPAGAVPERMSLPSPAGGPPFQVGVVSRIGPQEVLLRLVEGQPSGEEQAIRQRLNLTAREAEVLLWIARGKANRDIGQILGLSPRTVNKHLEQIYAKLGVENRTAAAALALRTLEGG
jgi:DNA-binding CsgD family transcriptional regulator